MRGVRILGREEGGGGVSLRTGCAENMPRAFGWMKTEAQTVAVRIQMPAWAMTAVPNCDDPVIQYFCMHIGTTGVAFVIRERTRNLRMGGGGTIPSTKLNCKPLPSCWLASPARPRRGSSSPRLSVLAGSSVVVWAILGGDA